MITRARLFSALVVTVVIALVAAACGGGEEEPAATQAPQPTATKAPPTTAVPPTTSPPAATAAPIRTPTPTPTPLPPTAAPLTPPSGPQAKFGGTLRWPWIGPLPNLDAHGLGGVGASAVMAPLMNWLVQNGGGYYRGGESGVAPDLALEWQVGPDSQTYTFRLAPNAKWHDGKPITAADVVFSLNRIAFDPSIPFARYRSTLAPMDKAEAVDDSTVRITTKTVSASFLARLGALGNFVYPQHGLQQLLDNKPIGGGPFRFVSYERDVRLLVERNPSYFKKDAQGRALPYLDRMEIFIIIDPPSRLAAFRTGRLDIMDNVTQVKESDFKNIKGSLPDLTGVALRTGWIYWLFRNKPPWSDVRVRKAFHLVMDRQEWNLINNEGQGDPYVLYTNTGGQWVVPPDEVATLPGYRQPKDADIAEAKRLLQEAGYDLKRVVPITIGTTYPNQAATGSGILRRSLGIDSTLIVREGVAFTQDQRAGNFEILYDSNSASVDDPSLTLPPWYRSNGNNNWTGFGDPELDKQLDALETTLDFKARLKIAQDVQRRITNELFWTAVHGGLARKYIWRGFIQGWVPHQGTQDGPPYRHETTWVEKS